MMRVHGHDTPDHHAAAIGAMPLPVARLEVARVLRAAMQFRRGDQAAFAAALHWNACLVTRLRERNVGIWGAGPGSFIP